jgi:uncharacterized membrane protein
MARRVNMAQNPISVIAAFYTEETKAGDALAQLKQMDKDGTVDIMDAAVMVRNADGRRVKIKETAELTPKKGAKRGAVAGAIVGIIFPPSILAMGAIGAAAGAALGHFTDQGFDNNLLKEIGENLPPGGYVDLTTYALDAEAAAKLTAEFE